ncbi:Serine/threonine-protein phosphatase 1 [Falsiruegeria litorea R37]|uniref:Serine/threonine-protein phosphatase 1 n=1 Tax=Falsiruegeria litorea R37 TaxID=1200284 RepID=A0A1Y5TED2_9RHOB|nr:metallophosphoesterase family protein [Falsiruegeria litorea]SLN62373.1 Serine/threonine-protein phosphatase 1 [Falsiruegeria litorea R37]
MTTPVYAIGDIHGQLGLLEAALDRIETDGGKDARIVFLGDYTDRGPDSRKVLDLLVQGRAQGRNWITLKGNHDRMFAMFMQDYPMNDNQLLVGYHWLHERLGGIETLASYGVDVPERARIHQVHASARQAIPSQHVAFLNDLPAAHLQDGLLFVHAGVRPEVAFENQTEDDLIWIRQTFLDYRKPHPWLVVHGHTPAKQAEHKGNRVNLDSGAAFGGPLSAAVFENGDCWLLTDQGRMRLVPEIG